MLRTKSRMQLCITLLSLNLIFIWGNSLVPGSVSEVISNWFKSILEAIFSASESTDSGGFWVRKLAHFTEFAALGIWLGWLAAMLGRGKILPFLCGAAAAGVDETIQCFVPGRGPGIRDVCIDSAGVLTGLMLLYLSHALYVRRTKHPMEDK